MNLTNSLIFYPLIIRSTLIVCGSIILYFLTQKIIIQASRQLTSRLPYIAHQRSQTIASLLKNTAKYLYLAISLSLLLSTWGINPTPIWAGAGIAGLVLGLGSQTLVKDFVTGLFIIFENYINVGDTVEIAGKTGKIVSIRLRNTILRDEKAHATHIIANSRIDIITKIDPKP